MDMVRRDVWRREIARPEKFALVGDACPDIRNTAMGPANHQWGSLTESNTPARVHGTQANLMFGDGHVSAMDKSVLLKTSQFDPLWEADEEWVWHDQ